VKVLVVDDDDLIRGTLRLNLSARGFTVLEAVDGNAALAAVDDTVDLVILDLGLPDLDGTEVVAGIRAARDVPILVLSGRSETADKVQALDLGANDFVTKPFSVDEVLARVRALTRSVRELVVAIGPVRIDLEHHEVTRDGDSVRLTPTEWGVLETLVRRPDRLVGKRELLTAVWGPAYVNESAYLRLYVGQLRKKLEVDPSRPRHFLTEPGLGYRFVP
jgi:two-component system KDP operon response regulator KdpE